ncbi:unnamed protein product [Anisakis simplex]|uniref:Gustatory receptor n=1 Tax=Anisakis simplex TaxID=6269 RepID=A0A0M3JW03_ANISI|nr:unnamed protein product [Anisakis simplex]
MVFFKRTSLNDDKLLQKITTKLDKDQLAFIRRHFIPILLAYHYTGCHFTTPLRGVLMKPLCWIQLLFVMTVVGLGGYGVMHVGYFLLTTRESHQYLSLILVAFTSAIQSLSSFLFVPYWQHSKPLDRLIQAYYDAQHCAGRARATRSIRIVILLGASYFLAFTTISIVSFTLRVNCIPYKMIMLAFWLNEVDHEKLFETFMEMFKTHRRLANAVRVMNQMFQVETF